MKGSRVGALRAVAVLVLAGLPAVASAQARTCEQVLPSDTRRLINAAGQEMIYFRDPVRVLCTGNIRIEADSAMMNRSAGTVQLVGRVVYVDGTQRLTADWANYLGRSDELFARGSVVITDLDDGSVVTGDELEYRRPSEARPESRMVVRGREVHASLHAAPGAEPEAAGTPEPTHVWSRRMEFHGETLYIAQTDVRIQRDGMRGGADLLRFDRSENRMTLTGAAHVEDDDYRLDAYLIDAFLEEDALREVMAERDARLVAEELSVFAERIRIALSDGQLDRMEAWNPADPDLAPRRALAIAEDFHLRADSIDARADAGRLRQVRAIGRAFGERDVEPEAGAAPVADVIARDWIQGDTIIGHFAQERRTTTEPLEVDAVSSSEDDPDEVETTVLERIDVIGGSSDALSLYRMESRNPAEPSPVNFMRAKQITLFMKDGEVTRVEAEGPIDGIYLDPTPAPRSEHGGAAAAAGADR